MKRSIFSAALLLLMAACGTSPVSVTEAPTTLLTSIPPTTIVAPIVDPTDSPELGSPLLAFPADTSMLLPNQIQKTRAILQVLYRLERDPCPRSTRSVTWNRQSLMLTSPLVFQMSLLNEC